MSQQLLRWTAPVWRFLTDCEICLFLHLILLLLVSQVYSLHKMSTIARNCYTIFKIFLSRSVTILKLRFVRQLWDTDQISVFRMRSHRSIGQRPLPELPLRLSYRIKNYTAFLGKFLWITSGIMKPLPGSQVFCCQKFSKFNSLHHTQSMWRTSAQLIR